MCARDPPPRRQHPVERKIFLIHCLVKMRAKIPLFSLNVSFCRMASPKVNNDVILRFKTSQYATTRKWVLHVNGSPTRMALRIEKKQQKTIPSENAFIIKFQPFIMICDNLDHQNMSVYFPKLRFLCAPVFTQACKIVNKVRQLWLTSNMRPHKG